MAGATRKPAHQATHVVAALACIRSRRLDIGGRSHARAEQIRARSPAVREILNERGQFLAVSVAERRWVGVQSNTREPVHACAVRSWANPPGGEDAHRFQTLSQYSRPGSRDLIRPAPILPGKGAHVPALLQPRQRRVQSARTQPDADGVLGVLHDRVTVLGARGQAAEDQQRRV